MTNPTIYSGSERILRAGVFCTLLDLTLTRECIAELLNSDCVVVRIKAAAYCLALRQDVEIGESILEEISSNHDYGIFRFNAEMTLKVWREKGELQIYQKKR